MPILGKFSPEDTVLFPIKYEWADELYEQAVRNSWYPHEIPLKEDMDDWAHMTDDEQHAIRFMLGFFNSTELIVNRSLALGIYPYIKSAECHMYLVKQMFEEANHCKSFKYVVDSFQMDREAVYGLHTSVPSMVAKEAFMQRYMDRMMDSKLDIDTVEGKRDFVRNLVATNLVMEGCWFYSGFMVALSFRQRNKMRNLGSMIQWVIRDESLHLKFGINLLHTILEENPNIVTQEFADEIRDIIIEGVDLESTYNLDLFPHGIQGLNADYVNQYVQYVADRRLEELGLPVHYNAISPAKWMATATDMPELVNFFEATNTSYEVNNGGHKAA